MRQYWVYILASASRVLYFGMTNDILRRVAEHREKLLPGFTSRYRVNRLVYCEEFGEPLLAIAREKQIKGYRRSKKIDLIEAGNPDGHDLAVDFGLEALSER